MAQQHDLRLAFVDPQWKRSADSCPYPGTSSGVGVILILTCSSEASVPSVVAGQDSFVMAGSYPQGLRFLMSSFFNEELQPLSLSSSPAHDIQRGCFANT